MKQTVKAFALAAMVAATANLNAADQYFDGSTTNALTASKWAATNAGPFTSGFTTGNTAVFATVNGTGSGSTGITVGGIRAEENFTISSASSTLSTGGTVATFNVFTGKKLDFTGVNISTAAGTGINKTGAGTLVLTSGGTYAGGFTLTAGTMVAGGANAMGSGGALNLNGGTLTVNSGTARDFTGKYAGGISIGGNIQLGDAVNVSAGTGNMTFSNNVALGGVTRTLTIGAGGTYTFGGVISNGGLTIDKVGSVTGTIALNGANTYTGTTSVTAGTLALGNANAIKFSPLDVTGTGSVTLTVAGTNTYTLGGLKNSLGTGTAGTILAAGANSITLNSTAASSVTIGSSGDFSSLAALRVTTSGAFTLGGTLSLSITTAFAPGAYSFKILSGVTTGTFSSVTLSGAYAGVLDGSNSYANNDGANLFSFNNATGVLSFTAVPESNEIGVAIGVLLTVLVVMRRRSHSG